MRNRACSSWIAIPGTWAAAVNPGSEWIVFTTSHECMLRKREKGGLVQEKEATQQEKRDDTFTFNSAISSSFFMFCFSVTRMPFSSRIALQRGSTLSLISTVLMEMGAIFGLFENTAAESGVQRLMPCWDWWREVFSLHCGVFEWPPLLRRPPPSGRTSNTSEPGAVTSSPAFRKDEKRKRRETKKKKKKKRKTAMSFYLLIGLT